MLHLHHGDMVAGFRDALAGIVTAHRVAMFVGQCSVESGGFHALVENLNYSADRLRAVWPLSGRLRGGG